ncbi:maleylpyruvate isomerase family mycothiol-dependent enzyme [Streptomonospora wellingtoniae]|uniref:Maleylpyruvate isomerase family mycothiol-dependent enzyme n=1 Tax=Streptomonospora wellingtoniae TaxID=3075544 RepID=A0ABU2KVR9_9ACTN|nr:maleylpyruvate isomerase family mycothiol-dependent enzyme [Streptomonospora sp. DSM 45055]MDT0303385.1 maleylpyruvate isomerase family mycothiol-dependent enzyme [Streptomonospora sp. DSM 45055]
MTMDHDRLCGHLAEQSRLLAAHLDGADLDLPVPACPGWTLRNLVRHLWGGHRWADETVRTRAAEPLPAGLMRDVDDDSADPSPAGAGEGAAAGAWLVAGAERLAATLRAAGPDARVWTPVPGALSGFYARRFAHETAVHRADAARALGTGFALDRAAAVDAVDEWMDLESLPMMLDVHPHKRELRGPGRLLAFEADGTASAERPRWLVDLTGDAIVCGRGTGPAAVTVTGPPAELLLVLMRRRPAEGADVAVEGDRALLDFWLERVAWS